MAMRYNWLAASGNANGLATASVVSGNAVNVGDQSRQKVRALSALVTVLAETNTFTWSGKWQVSNDNSTWVDVTNGSQNATAVAVATGTAGADSAVTRSYPAPEAVYAWKYCRFSLVTGGTTGASADTYAISYVCRTGA